MNAAFETAMDTSDFGVERSKFKVMVEQNMLETTL